MQKAVIIEGLRTPFVKANKEFASLHPVKLAAKNIKEFLLRSSIKGEDIDEVIFGNVATLSDSVNIARVAALEAGLPQSIPAVTVNRNCASSLESIVQATAKIQAGMADTVLAGGVESMSHTPLYFNDPLEKFVLNLLSKKSLLSKLKSLFSFRPHFLIPRFSLKEALTDPITGLNMGETAEILAKEFAISREEQDRFAAESHQKASSQREKLQEEVFPLFIETDKKAVSRVREDQDKRKLFVEPNKKAVSRVKEDQDKRKLFVEPNKKAVSKDTAVIEKPNPLRFRRAGPYFDKKYGTVTVFNSCPISDGSALLLLMREEKALSLGLKPLASVHTTAFKGLEPERMGLGPVYASAEALKKAGLLLTDIDLIEINEAFAAQTLACLKAFNSNFFAKEKLGLNKALGEIDRSRLNVNGGAIAIGHPVAATGARIVFTLAKEMKRQDKQWGLATLCVGGGQGGAILLENYKN